VNDELERIWKKLTRPNFKELSRHSPGDTEENHDKTCENPRSRGRYFNPAPPKYETGVLNTQSRSSAFHFHTVAILNGIFCPEFDARTSRIKADAMC